MNDQPYSGKAPHIVLRGLYLCLAILSLTPRVGWSASSQSELDAALGNLYSHTAKLTSEQRAKHSDSIKAVVDLFAESPFLNGRFRDTSALVPRHGIAKLSYSELEELNRKSLPILIAEGLGKQEAYNPLNSSFIFEGHQREHKILLGGPSATNPDPWVHRSLRNEDLGKWFFELTHQEKNGAFQPIRIELPHPPYAFTFEEVLQFERKLLDQLKELESNPSVSISSLVGAFNYIKGSTQRALEIKRRLIGLEEAESAVAKLVQEGIIPIAEQAGILEILVNERKLANVEMIRVGAMKPFPRPFNATGPSSCLIGLRPAEERFKEMEQQIFAEELQRQRTQHVMQKVFQALEKSGHTVH